MSAATAGFRPDERIRRRAEYRQVYTQGARLRGQYLTLFVKRSERPRGRLGIAATRKLGNAVHRNRAKRLIREVFRLNKPAPGVDIVVVPGPELMNASLSALEQEFREILARALRRLQPR